LQMPGAMAARVVVICTERERLKRAYLDAILEFNLLSRQRMEAVLRGTEPPSQSTVASADARQKTAIYAIFSHVYDHGC
jgi:hypothetical protein